MNLQAYIAFKISEKGRLRREKEERDWKQAVIGDRRKYCCRTCLHRISTSCKGLSVLSRICRYWWSCKPDSKIKGLAF